MASIDSGSNRRQIEKGRDQNWNIDTKMIQDCVYKDLKIIVEFTKCAKVLSGALTESSDDDTKFKTFDLLISNESKWFSVQTNNVRPTNCKNINRSAVHTWCITWCLADEHYIKPNGFQVRRHIIPCIHPSLIKFAFNFIYSLSAAKVHSPLKISYVSNASRSYNCFFATVIGLRTIW